MENTQEAGRGRGASERRQQRIVKNNNENDDFECIDSGLLGRRKKI